MSVGLLAESSVIVGIDTGGTFTDFALLDGRAGTLRTFKVLSTPKDFAVGFIEGLSQLAVNLESLKCMVHGTTVATNALIERRGARCGLITTKGFRDVLELGRRERPNIYGLVGQFEPLIERQYRLEVTERTSSDGDILTALDEDEVADRTRWLMSQGVQAIVISFLHSYANPHNEERAKAIVRALWPNDFVVSSSEILPEFREFERTSTCSVSAYVQPIVASYLGAISERIAREGFEGDLLVMQSNGGVMGAHAAGRHAVNTILSGPAAGVKAATHIAGLAGWKNFISCDMGGTSLDVCLVRGGRATMLEEREVSYRIPIRSPMLDIETLGAGGGSVAWLDGTGILQVGPRSAGADPGPAAYAKGGEEPTVTDANLVVGKIDPDRAIGDESTFKLRVELARKAIASRIAEPLSISVEEAALSIIEVVNNRMANAIRQVSVGRGEDPREYALVMFGGAGPLHACAIMRMLDLSRTIIPLYPGITSALGCALSDLRYDFVQTVNRNLEELEPSLISGIYAAHLDKGKALIERDRVEVNSIESQFSADMMYEGQTHTLRVDFGDSRPTIANCRETFAQAYGRRYSDSHAYARPWMMNLRTTVTGIRADTLPPLMPLGGGELGQATLLSRPVYVEHKWVSCRVVDRLKLAPGVQFSGPTVLQQSDCTTFVGPGDEAVVDNWGNLIIAAGG